MTPWQQTFIEHPVLGWLLETAHLSSKTYLVGGVVRDVILGKNAFHEIDLTTLVDVEELAIECERLPFVTEVKYYKKFGTLSIFTKPFHGIDRVDIVRARRETYEIPGGLPRVFPGCISEDLARRDFTCNAIALPVTTLRSAEWVSELIDPHSGVTDIKQRKITFLHERSFLDDPTRIFRGARYAGRLEFSFEEKTLQAIIAAVRAGALQSISVERISHELELVCKESEYSKMLSMLGSFAVFDALGVPSLLGEFKQLGDRSEDRVTAFKLVWLYCALPECRSELAPKLQLSKKFLKTIQNVTGVGEIRKILDERLSQKRVAKNA